MTPAWILDVLAALMLLVAALSAARIVLARPWRSGASVADTDVAHLLMAIAMAGMLTPRLGTLPDPAWEAVFCLLAVWFAGRVAREAGTNGRGALLGAHCAPHLVHSASMLYMFLAVTAPPARTGTAEGMGGMSAGAGSAAMTLSLPALAFVFAFILVGYAVWDLDQLSGRRYATTARVSLAGTVPVEVGPIEVPVSAAVEASAAPPPDTWSGHEPRQAHDSRPARGAQSAAALLLSPAVTVGCRIAMGLTMAFMLLIAL